MDTPFVYDRYVTGKGFVGRRQDCTILSNLLKAGEHVLIFDPPKSGKMSVVQQTLYNMRSSGEQFAVIHVNMFNVRTIEQFLIKYGTAIIRQRYTTTQEYETVVSNYLSNTHFVFDQDRFAAREEVVSLNWDIDDNDIEQMLLLPFRLAAESEIPSFIILEEFQNIMFDKDYDRFLKIMEKVAAQNKGKVSYIFMGSMVNAMKLLFREQKYFHRIVEYLPLQKVDYIELTDFLIRGFMDAGKVWDRELAMSVCELFRGQMWYLNHFTSICDNVTRGYINEGVCIQALKILLSIHEPRFVSIVNDLTGYQLSFLRATLEGVVRFSSFEVIEKYSMNSSANVRRVKDALMKKEVITFNEKDEPEIMDPLFEHWLIKHYFAIK